MNDRNDQRPLWASFRFANEEGFSAFVVIDDLPSLGSGSVGVIHSEEMSWKLIHLSLVVNRSP